MTFGVPGDLLVKIRSNQVHELEVIIPDYAAFLTEKGVSFHEQEGATPPYQHIGFVPSACTVHVAGPEVISEPVRFEGGWIVRIRWGSPEGAVAPLFAKS